MKPTTITIDGPAGSGKGTTARLLAEKLGFQVIDTGSLYRAVAVYLAEHGYDLDQVGSHLPDMDISCVPGVSVMVNGIEYIDRIRTPEAGIDASRVGIFPSVRKIVNDAARDMLLRSDSVIEGRDMGVVFDDLHPIKIYLNADPSVRAHRRWLELTHKGETISEAEILRQIIERDQRDMTREVSPLVRCPDAIEIDTTHTTIPEQVEEIYTIVRSQLGC